MEPPVKRHTVAQIRKLYGPVCKQAIIQFQIAELAFARADWWRERQEPWAPGNVRTWQGVACRAMDRGYDIDRENRRNEQ